MISALCNDIFERSIHDYHLTDNVDAPMNNSCNIDSIEHLLYNKNWIDTVQWHLEDIVRNPTIDPVEGLALKRRIDASNQQRTDMVEYIDSYFLAQYKGIAGIYQLYKELKAASKFDAIADLHSVLRSSFLKTFFRFSSYTIATIDKGRKQKKELTRKENKIFKPLTPMH